MRKIFLVLFCALLAVSFTACSDFNKGGEASKKSKSIGDAAKDMARVEETREERERISRWHKGNAWRYQDGVVSGG